jgi:peptidoglycan/LPS O-acetylase OafA/YrhL
MKKKLNFDILESLRGLASLYVCIGHSRAILWIGGEHYQKIHPRSTWAVSDYLLLGLNMLTRLSTEFVIVFFVLSGFSIAHSLRNNTTPAPFYKRRFIRLYPPYIAALLWAMLIVGIIKWTAPHFMDGTYNTPAFDRLAASAQLFDWKVFFRNLVYLPQLDGVLRPFWSLTQEVIFYLLAPFLFRNKRVYYISSAVMFVLMGLATRFQWVQSSIITDYFYYNIFFAVGVALYSNYDTVLDKGKLWLSTSKALWVSLAIFFAMIGISLAGYEMLNAFMAASMSVLLIIYLLSNNKQVNWMINMGRFSYTLYITHFPGIFLYMCLYYLFSRADPPYIYNNLVFIPCVCFCLGIAYLQYNLVEKRSKEILDKLRSKNREKSGQNKYPVSINQ